MQVVGCGQNLGEVAGVVGGNAPRSHDGTLKLILDSHLRLRASGYELRDKALTFRVWDLGFRV